MDTDLMAVIDTETTGLCPLEGRIWEAAVLIYDRARRQIVSEHSWQLELTAAELENADPVALEIGRFAERRLPPDELDPPWLIAEALAALTAGLPLVGANPSFDEERIRRLCWRFEIEPSWHYRPVCIEALAVGFLHGRSAGMAEALTHSRKIEAAPTPEAASRLPWGSTAVCEALGVARPQSEAHTALGDCRWALAVWRAVMER